MRRLQDATLANCNLSEAKLDGADLTGAGLQKAQLYKADLKCVRWGAPCIHHGCSCCCEVRLGLLNATCGCVWLFPFCNRGACLRDADLTRANLQVFLEF